MTRKPTTAAEFVSFMEEVWAMNCRPSQDGQGVILTGSPLYDEYYNARSSARRFGAVRTGGSYIDGSIAHVFRFPSDGDHIAVIISPKGDACKISHHARKRAKEG